MMKPTVLAASRRCQLEAMVITITGNISANEIRNMRRVTKTTITKNLTTTIISQSLWVWANARSLTEHVFLINEFVLNKNY